MGQLSLTEREIDERVGVLKHIRSTLLEQRKRFQAYLERLEDEEDAIASGDIDRIASHAELEQSIVAEIYRFQRVIDPLEQICRVTNPSLEPDIPQLRTSLARMKDQVLKRNEHNRELLRRSAGALRNQVASLRITRRKPMFVPSSEAPRLVDVTT